MAQISPIYAIATHDFDNDGDLDIALGGNLYGVKPELGRYDASYGLYLENKGNLNFESAPQGQGFKLKGEIRDIKIDGSSLFVAKNKDTLTVFDFGH